MKVNIKKLLVVVLCLVLAASFGGSALAGPSPREEAAEFYRGKTINFVLSHPPGSVITLKALTFQRALEEFTGATVVFDGHEGASGLVAANYIYNVAPKDGLTIGTSLAGAIILSELAGAAAAANYSFENINWIADIATNEMIYVSTGGGRFRTAADLIGAANMLLAGSVPGHSAGSFADLVTMEVLADNGTTTRYITGYESESTRRIAVLQGECELSWQFLNQKALFDEGLLNPLFTFSRNRMPELPDVPSIFEAGFEVRPEMVDLLDTAVELSLFHNVIIAPPGVPENRIAFLHEAFEYVLAQEDVLEVFADNYLTASFIPPAEVKARAHEIYNMAQRNWDRLGALIDQHR